MVCDDPAWAVRFLQLLAPSLEEVEIVAPSRKHVVALMSMPLLRRLWLSYEPRDEAALELELPALTPPPPPPPSNLRWLHVCCSKGPTLLATLKALGAVLEDLQVGVICREYPVDADPGLTSGLASLLVACELAALKRLEVGHDAYADNHHAPICRGQVAAILEALPAVAVRCQLCTDCTDCTDSDSSSDCSGSSSGCS